MTTQISKPLRCAVYTRVSTDAGLGQDFNSLDAQREACEAYIKSQTHEGWRLIKVRFDDGAFPVAIWNGPHFRRFSPRLKNGGLTLWWSTKVDRLTRSLADFAKLVEVFDAHWVSFVSVTQSFNTTTSMGSPLRDLLGTTSLLAQSAQLSAGGAIKLILLIHSKFLGVNRNRRIACR